MVIAATMKFQQFFQNLFILIQWYISFSYLNWSSIKRNRNTFIVPFTGKNILAQKCEVFVAIPNSETLILNLSLSIQIFISNDRFYIFLIKHLDLQVFNLSLLSSDNPQTGPYSSFHFKLCWNLNGWTIFCAWLNCASKLRYIVYFSAI